MVPTKAGSCARTSPTALRKTPVNSGLNSTSKSIFAARLRAGMVDLPPSEAQMGQRKTALTHTAQSARPAATAQPPRHPNTVVGTELPPSPRHTTQRSFTAGGVEDDASGGDADDADEADDEDGKDVDADVEVGAGFFFFRSVFLAFAFLLPLLSGRTSTCSPLWLASTAAGA